jgi:hypothetical protein
MFWATTSVTYRSQPPRSFGPEVLAESLGFQGRIVHTKNKSEWLRELRLRNGELPNRGMQQQSF